MRSCILLGLVFILFILAAVADGQSVKCTTTPSGFFGDVCTGNRTTVDSCADDDNRTGYKVLECNKYGNQTCDSHFHDVVEKYKKKCNTDEGCNSSHLECVQDYCGFKRRDGDLVRSFDKKKNLFLFIYYIFFRHS